MYSDANVRAPYVWWSGAISNPNISHYAPQEAPGAGNCVSAALASVVCRCGGACAWVWDIDIQFPINLPVKRNRKSARPR